VAYTSAPISFSQSNRSYSSLPAGLATACTDNNAELNEPQRNITCGWPYSLMIVRIHFPLTRYGLNIRKLLQLYEHLLEKTFQQVRYASLTPVIRVGFQNN